jgi:hypothetical protein
MMHVLGFYVHKKNKKRTDSHNISQHIQDV